MRKHLLLWSVALLCTLQAFSQTIKGLTVVVGYSDRASNIDMTTVTNMMNASSGFNLWSNNGSVREYWQKMSNNKVDLTQTVIKVVLTRTAAYYHGPNLPYDGGQELVKDVVAAINQQYPTGFTGLTPKPNDGRLWCFNLLSLDGFGGGVAYGVGNNLSIKNNGVSLPIRHVALNKYGNLTPDINVICHELGHHVFDWADYYNNSSLVATNLGHYCLMGSGGALGSPMPVSAPLRHQKGWITNVVDLTNKLREEAVYPVIPNDYTTVYKFINEHNTREYLLIEAATHSRYYLSKTGDGYVPDQGLMIWYVDEEGGFSRSGQSNHLYVKLIQADGQDEMHDLSKTHRDHRGDDADLFGRIVKAFSASSTYFTWKNGSAIGLNLSVISDITPTSTGPLMAIKTPASRTLEVTAGINGTILPKGMLNCAPGSSKTLTIVPDIGYETAEVKVNNVVKPITNTLTFSNIQTTYQTAFASFKPSLTQDRLPNPWSLADIGRSSHPIVGVGGYRNGAFGITSYGADIWNNDDQFTFIHQQLNGDGEIIARIASYNRCNDWSKSGVMIRESLEPGSKHFLFAKTGTQGFAPQYRKESNGPSFHNEDNLNVGGAPDKAYWIKLKRAGQTFTAYYSMDGVSWTLAQTETIPMQAKVYIGLCASGAFGTTMPNKTVFDQVTVNATIPNLFGVYNVPSPTAIPAGFKKYSRVYTVGTGGPNLSNVFNSVFNWQGSTSNPKGLYQFTLETTNGVPRSYTNLTDFAVYALHTNAPYIVFNQSTGFPGLAGSYWINFKGNDLVLVDVNGNYAIVFTNTTPTARNTFDKAQLDELTCYPNPSQGVSMLEIPAKLGRAHVTVLNMTGAIVETHEDASGTLSIGEKLRKGVYLIQVKTENLQKTIRFVKQ